VAVSGPYAYAARGSYGLGVFDISNPRSPQYAGGVNTPGYAQRVTVSGTHAYVADHTSGLQVIDITNAQSPEIVGSLDTPGYARDVIVSGAYAYIADGPSGLQVIDITDPQSPRIVSSVDTPEDATGVAVSGACAYVADHYSGLQVIDISDLEDLKIIGSVASQEGAKAVAVSGTFAYVADFGRKLVVLSTQCDPAGVWEDHQAPSTMRLMAYPNPASCRTFIRFETRASGPVAASVYDPAGRRIRGLSAGVLGAGDHQLLWDGHEDDGRAAPAGVYLVRVSTPEGTTSSRLVMVR